MSDDQRGPSDARLEEEDRKPSAAARSHKRKQNPGELVYVRHGKLDYKAFLIHAIDVETPLDHVWVRYEDARTEDCVKKDRVTPFVFAEGRSSRSKQPQVLPPAAVSASQSRAHAQGPMDHISLSDSQAASPLAVDAPASRKRLFSPAVAKDNRKAPPPAQQQQPSHEIYVARSSSPGTISELTLPSEASISVLSFGSGTSFLENDKTHGAATAREAQAPALPLPVPVEAPQYQPPFDRATLRHMAKINKRLKNLPGFSWEPFDGCPALPPEYIDYLATLPLKEAIVCQQAMKAFAVLTLDESNTTFLPVQVFMDARPKKFGLQSIAKHLNSQCVTLLKESSCSFTRPLTSSTEVVKPYFLCLMIGVERPLLRHELVFKHWTVKVVSNDRDAILQACGSVAPDFIYASADCGLEELVDTLAWARDRWRTRHCVVESAKCDCHLLGDLPEVMMQETRLKDSALWVTDDTLFTRLLRYQSKLALGSHAIAQVIAFYVDSECELRIPRPWPESLTAVAEAEEEDGDDEDEDQDEIPVCAYVKKKETIKSTTQKKSRVRKSSEKKRRANAKASDVTDASVDTCEERPRVSLLPYIFENDELYNSLTDDAER